MRPTIAPRAAPARATRGIARTGVRKAGADAIARRSKKGRGALYAPMDPLATMEPGEKIALLERLEKLARARPVNLGQAGRLEGVTPAALTALLAHVRKARNRSAPVETGQVAG